jgi:acyl-CoA hydrolase
MDWKKKVVDPDRVMEKISPGMRIFLGTGVSEPCTLVRHLMNSSHKGLVDLELIQLVNFSNTITLKTLDAHKFRLKTFSSGHMVNNAIEKGLVDLIPVRFNKLQRLFDSERIQVDAAFVQTSQPDISGNASLGISVDMARSAMKQAASWSAKSTPIFREPLETLSSTCLNLTCSSIPGMIPSILPAGRPVRYLT